MLSAPVFAEPIAVDIEQKHPNGGSILLHSVELTDTEVRLDLRIINGLGNEITLRNGERTTYVVTGDGTRLSLVPPESNEHLNIPAFSKVEGHLVFMGAVPSSGVMTVVFNESGSADGESAVAPRFEFTLPPELVEQAVSKKN